MLLTLRRVALESLVVILAAAVGMNDDEAYVEPSAAVTGGIFCYVYLSRCCAGTTAPRSFADQLTGGPRLSTRAADEVLLSALPTAEL